MKTFRTLRDIVFLLLLAASFAGVLHLAAEYTAGMCECGGKCLCLPCECCE